MSLINNDPHNDQMSTRARDELDQHIGSARQLLDQNVPLDGPGWHRGAHADGRFDGGESWWWSTGARKVVNTRG